MRTFLDAKLMARTLRAALAERGIAISHSESLELVARAFGLADWNTLAAQIGALEAGPALPPGWYRTGSSDPAHHRMSVDPDDPAGVTIESVADRTTIADRFASLARTVLADDFRGDGIRLSVELKGERCDRAFIWMRVDPKGGGSPLAFDNLSRQPEGMLSGSFGWTRREIVLPVAGDADRVPYGVGLIGAGRLWARAVTIGPSNPGERAGAIAL